MTLESLIFLAELYWPFLLAAALVGVGTGWLTYRSEGK